MKKFIANIFILLLSATAVLSCSAEMDMPGDVVPVGAIEVSGAVVDSSTGTPLDEIRITLTTSESNAHENAVLVKTAYTGSNGLFTIMADGFEGRTSCILIAEDPEGIYESASQTVNITWSVNNVHQGIFYVNDVNFYLEKAAK